MADEGHVPARAMVVQFEGTAYPFIDFTPTEDIGEVEMTHLTSPKTSEGLLQYECINDVVKTTFKGTLAVPIGATPSLPRNTALDVDVSTTGGYQHVGTARLSNLSYKGGAKGGYTIDVSGTFTGDVTRGLTP